MAITLITLRRFSSCQKPGLLFDIYAKNGFYASYDLSAKKSNTGFQGRTNLIMFVVNPMPMNLKNLIVKRLFTLLFTVVLLSCDREPVTSFFRNQDFNAGWLFQMGDPEGIEIGKTLAEAIKEVDNTRPVTQAVCAFWDNSGRDWDYTAGAFSMLDIGGYNYQLQNYESDHQKYPDRVMYGSESFPQYAWENWEMVKRHKYVLGDFVWTGMDYIGESGIGHHRLVGQQDEGDTFLKPWPSVFKAAVR